VKTVKEVSELTGISVRTLHYYDEIGILAPSGMTRAGYRLYDDEALESLQHILFLRELEFPLKDIKTVLENDGFDNRETMEKHRRLLMMKRDRLDRLIKLTDRLLKGETEMSFKEFDMTDIEKARKRYADEARGRWGKGAQYAQSEERAAAYTRNDWQRITEEANSIYSRFAENMDKAADDPEVADAVRSWKQHITDNYYECTDEILAGLGEMYVADERFKKNIGRHCQGLAKFMSEAIKAYCGKKQI